MIAAGHARRASGEPRSEGVEVRGNVLIFLILECPGSRTGRRRRVRGPFRNRAVMGPFGRWPGSRGAAVRRTRCRGRAVPPVRGSRPVGSV